MTARAAALIDELAAETRRSLPPGSVVFDAHVHVGTDDDGASATAEEVLAGFRRYGVRSSFAFCMNEPERASSFRAANDRTLAAAEESGGALLPFARLDLGDGALEEAERCFARDARGLKLHTRAQPLAGWERELAQLFALAASHRAPILVHGGLGMPPVAGLLCDLFERTPGASLIVAHGGIADLATFAERLGGSPGAYFDTSVWSPFDLLAVLAAVPPEQLLYGSDVPYGQLPNMLLLALRAAVASGWSEQQVRGLVGGNALRLAALEEAGVPTQAVGQPRVELDLARLRVHNYTAAAMRTLWSRRSSADATIALAERACATSGLEPTLRNRLEALLALAAELWRAAAAEADDSERRSLNRMVFQLLHLADIEAVLGDGEPADGPAAALAGSTSVRER